MATPVNIEKLNSFLGPKIHTCPVCHQAKTYSVLPKLMELREFNDGDLVLGGNSVIVPLVVIGCSNCGNTILINAIQAGLVSPNPPQKNEG